jgi:arylsulfatase A-like enzyme
LFWWEYRPENKAHAQRTGKDPRELIISNIDKHGGLPHWLGKQGYLSHQSGKWWEGSYQRGGFTEGMSRGYPKPGGRHGDDGLKIGRAGMDPVFDFIDRSVKQEKPFFIWYAPFLPHTPHNPPERLHKKYLAKGVNDRVAKYYAMCEWFDETCGALMNHIDESGIAEDTPVIYVTDNGWIQSRKVMRSLGSGGSQYGGREVDGGTEFGPVGRRDRSLPPEHDGVACAPFVGTALGADCITPGLGLNPAVVGYVNDRVAKYYAMCEWFDETCGALMNHIDESGIAEDTLVIYVTDNGWIQSRKVMRSLGSGGSQYGGREVDGGTEFGPVGRRDRSLPAEHDGVACAPFVGTALGADCITPGLGLNPAVVGYVNDRVAKYYAMCEW